jgi:hypothetical protein
MSCETEMNWKQRLENEQTRSLPDALIHNSAMFSTGDKFLVEPWGLITDMLSLRLRPMRFQTVMTRFVHHAAHYGFSCNVWRVCSVSSAMVTWFIGYHTMLYQHYKLLCDPLDSGKYMLKFWSGGSFKVEVKIGSRRTKCYPDSSSGNF